MKNVINIYMKKLEIKNFNSDILVSNEDSKRAIKFWISPNEYLQAKLLYSFNIHYNPVPHKQNQYEYEFDETIRNFHRSYDYKKSILIICKSKNQIFGGYTPLSFASDDTYGCDNESFLFSLIKSSKKYPKDSFNESKSIWKYKNYGPCFHYN